MYRDELLPIWSTLGHPFVVSFLGVVGGDNSPPALEVPFFENGNIIAYNSGHREADKLQQVRCIPYQARTALT